MFWHGVCTFWVCFRGCFSFFGGVYLYIYSSGPWFGLRFLFIHFGSSFSFLCRLLRFVSTTRFECYEERFGMTGGCLLFSLLVYYSYVGVLLLGLL